MEFKGRYDCLTMDHVVGKNSNERQGEDNEGKKTSREIVELSARG